MLPVLKTQPGVEKFASMTTETRLLFDVWPGVVMITVFKIEVALMVFFSLN